MERFDWGNNEIIMMISVVVPVYNTEKYVDRCISSICGQTYRELEVILVDDGSTDGSGRICDEWVEKDDRVHVIHVENGGVSRARNLGIDVARGDYICFVDSDDWIEADYFEEAVPILVKKRPICLIHNYVTDDGAGKIFCKFPPSAEIDMNAEKTFREMATGCHFGWQPVASFYEANGCKNIQFPTDIIFGEDLLFNFRFTQKNPGLYIYQRIAKYHYFTRPGSAVTGYSISQKMDDMKVFETVMEEAEPETRELILWKEYAPRLISRYIRGMKSADACDREAALILRKKISQHFVSFIRCSKLSFTMKLKAAICLLPEPAVCAVNAVYRRMKRKSAHVG